MARILTKVLGLYYTLSGPWHLEYANDDIKSTSTQ
jgi:hypothetical protein